MIRDFNIDWLEKRIWLPWTVFTSMGVTNRLTVAAGAVAVTSTAANGAIINGAGSTSSSVSATSIPVLIASSLMAGLQTSTQNDGVSTAMMTPYDLDINKQVRFRVHYSQTAVSGTVSWKVLYTVIAATQAGTAGATVIIAPATALDTAIPAASGTVVANDWRMTDFGIIKKNSLAGTPIAESTYGLLLAVTITDAAPVAGLSFLGLEMRYTPRKTGGPRRNILGGRRLLDANPLGSTPGKLHAKQEGL